MKIIRILFVLFLPSLSWAGGLDFPSTIASVTISSLTVTNFLVIPAITCADVTGSIGVKLNALAIVTDVPGGPAIAIGVQFGPSLVWSMVAPSGLTCGF